MKKIISYIKLTSLNKSIPKIKKPTYKLHTSPKTSHITNIQIYYKKHFSSKPHQILFKYFLILHFTLKTIFQQTTFNL